MFPYLKKTIKSSYRLTIIKSTNVMSYSPGTVLRALLITQLSLAAVILLGCNVAVVQVQTSSNSVPVTSLPAPSTPTPVDFQPLLTSFQALTGCSNPNTGTPTGDWGADVPVYTKSSSVQVNNNYPTYNSNNIFWTSRETGPGQSVLMTGAFTNASKSVRVALIPPGTVDWQNLVRQSTAVVPAIQQGTTGLSFIVPSNFSTGVYGFQVDDPSAP